MSHAKVEINVNQPAICPNPIFIIGSPRSGTSILAWSLAQHSHLWTSAESDILYFLFARGHLEKAFETARARPDGTWLRKQGVDKREFYGYLGLGINALFTSRTGGRRWVDQTPLYTMMVDVLADLFPGALFLHILRDGRRVVHSMINFENNLGPELKAEMIEAGRLPRWASDFADACAAWNRFVETALDFGARNPSRCLTVTNEALVENPGQNFCSIFDFLRVPREDAPIKYFRTHRINSSFPQLASTGLADPGRVDPWEQWSVGQRETFIASAGRTLTKCGYVVADSLALSAYERLIFRIQEIVKSAVPCGSYVLVVSRGDEAMLNLEGRKAEHFPQADAGIYAGHHPATSEEAIAQLERLRANGAAYLVFPRTSMWWLDHYVEFREYLERGNPVVLRDESCSIFALNVTPRIANPGEEKRPAILDAGQASAMTQGR